MRSYLSTVLVALMLLVPGCASRIHRQPVPEEDRIRSIRLMLNGDQLIKEGKDHLALASYIEASTLDPYNETIFNKLAIAYSRILMFEQAQAAVLRATRLNPDYPFAYNTQGIVFLASDQPRRALASFKKAIRLRKIPLFYINLGNAYIRLDEFDSARESFVQALRLDPNAFNLEDSIQVETKGKEQDPERFYRLATLFGEMGARESTLEYLGKALSNGFRDAERLGNEPAFNFLRNDESFLRLLGAWGMQP